MSLLDHELKSHLNPTAIRILKKRLVSGKITPQVFKDILKQQMIKQFFRNYRHPLLRAWENCWKSDKNPQRENRRAASSHGQDDLETSHHKRF